MMRPAGSSVCTVALVVVCVFAGTCSANFELHSLNDDFDDPSTFTDWTWVYQSESWPWQMEVADMTTEPGKMLMIPYSNAWFDNYRGPLMYKLVTGDFMFAVRVRSRNRANNATPSALYSLAGPMIRAPGANSSDWVTGQEQFVFLSLGAADTVSAASQNEVKITTNGDSVLTITQAPNSAAELELMIVRIGAYVITLRREINSTAWVVHRRFRHDFLPSTLQVGMCAYTDWDTVSGTSPSVSNYQVLTSGNPDLRAEFDWARFCNVTVPASLDGLDLDTEAQVSDAQLLDFLDCPDPNSKSTKPPTSPEPFDVTQMIIIAASVAGSVVLVSILVRFVVQLRAS